MKKTHNFALNYQIVTAMIMLRFLEMSFRFLTRLVMDSVYRVWYLLLKNIMESADFLLRMGNFVFKQPYDKILA